LQSHIHHVQLPEQIAASMLSGEPCTNAAEDQDATSLFLRWPPFLSKSLMQIQAADYDNWRSGH